MSTAHFFLLFHSYWTFPLIAAAKKIITSSVPAWFLQITTKYAVITASYYVVMGSSLHSNYLLLCSNRSITTCYYSSNGSITTHYRSETGSNGFITIYYRPPEFAGGAQLARGGRTGAISVWAWREPARKWVPIAIKALQVSCNVQ